MAFFNLLQKRFFQLPTYKGPFVLKERPVNKGNPAYRIEEALDDLKAARDSPLPEPSPFHMVKRIISEGNIPWWDKLVMRNLGLNSRDNMVWVIVPNTPHFNQMLWQVKHLIELKPISFPNGIPTEKDIGATRLCTETGRFEIKESLRVNEKALQGDQISFFYKGGYLKRYLKRICGVRPGGMG